MDTPTRPAATIVITAHAMARVIMAAEAGEADMATAEDLHTVTPADMAVVDMAADTEEDMAAGTAAAEGRR